MIKRTSEEPPKKSRLKAVFKYVGVAVVILLAAAGLYLVTPKATPEPPKSEVSLTKTPDYNACNVIKASDIQSTFYGDLITGISPSARAGVEAPNGTIADSCGFSLTTAKSYDNSLSVEVYDYTAVTNGKNNESNDATWSEVASSNPKAYFSKDVDGDTIIYKLRVIPGGKNVLFQLRQPLSNRAIDEPSALDFIVGLAAKADYKVIEPTDSF